MRFVIFLLLFLLTPLSLAVANETSDREQASVCLVSVPKSVFDLPEIALEKTKLALSEAKTSAVDAAKALPERVDDLALSLADRLEATKTPSTNAQETDSTDPHVLGASTDSPNQSLTASAYNAGVDVLGFLLRHWLWTIAGLGVSALFFAFRL